MRYECVRINSGSFVSRNSVFRDAAMGFGYYGGSGTYVYNGVVADCTIACRASNKHFVNTVFYNCLTFLESTSSSADHCVFYNPPDWGAQTATQVGKNGNIWGDPLFVDAANGDFRIREGSPCVDAADSSAAPELDYFGQPRITFTGRTNDTELAEGPLADIGICEVMPRDVTSDIDLVPEAVRTEKTATPGQLLFVKWEVRNQGGAPVDATWRDTVSLVSHDGREVVLGDKATKSAIAVGGSVFCSGYFTVPAMAEGTWYPKVNVNSYHDIFEGSLTANNALVGTGGVEVAVKEVESEGEEGVVNAGAPTVKKITLPETGGNRMVRIKVPAGVTIRWGFGFVPTGNQKSGTLTSNGQDVLFRVPDGVTDVYVSMESDGGAEYDLSLEEGQVVITGVSPNTLPSSGRVRVTANGAGFDADTRIALVNGGTRVSPAEMAYVDENTLVATYDCSALVGGAVYDCEVTGGNGMAILENSVTVSRAEGKGVLELSYDIPKSVRAGRLFTFTVTCRNVGTADLCCPLVTVSDFGNSNVNSFEFSLDGASFTTGGFQFVSKDPNGIFDGLRPGDAAVTKVYARLMSSNGANATGGTVHVRANSENDTMSGFPTEIDNYFSAVQQDASGEDTAKLRELFGNTNGDMVRNFSRIAKMYYLCNGFALQKVQDLIGYGLAYSAVREEESSSRASMPVDLSFHSLSLPMPTGVYLYKNGSWVSLADEKIDLANRAVAVISHGLDDGFSKGSWLGDLASALKDTGDFDHVLCVHWEKEATPDWSKAGISGVSGALSGSVAGTFIGTSTEVIAELRCVSGRIPRVCQIAIGQLAGKHLDPSKATFIGHSFGSHLLGYLSMRLGKVRRHIGLDTAAAVAVDSSIAIRRSYAQQTEFYRSSFGSGQEDPYADFNYVVAKHGSLDVFSQAVKANAFLGHHSYAWEWFVSNVKYGKNYGIGYWSAHGGPQCLESGKGYRGVILGPAQRFECIYPYSLDGVEGVNYPGNQSSWGGLRRNWQNVADLHIDSQSVSVKPNEVFDTGVPQKINVSALDFCRDDVFSIQRRQHLVQLKILARNQDGRGTPVTVYQSPLQYGLSFNGLDFTVDDSVLNAVGERAILDFAVDRLVLDFNRKEGVLLLPDLNPADNVCSVPVTLKRGEGPQADINGYRNSGFVVERVQKYDSPEKYQQAVQDGKTFTLTWDGRASRCRTDCRIARYVWRERDGETVASEKSTFVRDYYEFSQGDYLIALSVQDDKGRWSTVYGYLRNIVKIGEGTDLEIPQSIDPNEMAGPIGLGDPETERYVKPGEWMTYTVYFENRADATAAAQEVRVTNPLSPYLDWSTFEMGEVAFNNQIDLGLSGKRNGTSEAVMKGTNTLVRTQLTLNEKTGIAEWYLRIVDPTTATGWPEDVFAGFLPPNDETFRGEGHLTYRVKVRDDAPHGVRIDNSASIVFDYNEPIETDPSWWNMVARTLEAGFVEPEVAVDEGGTATVAVRGGSAERAVSVQVYLAYQTASAADLDLKNAKVDGATPKGGLRFPLTLSWAAGEIGAKTITIPVKADRAVENEELFTLQLANVQGMGVGDASCCTVTIRDANAAADYAARQGKTMVRTKKGVPDCALSIGCVAMDGSGEPCGYTTGQGSYYTGCKASLKATARPGWAFAGWGEVEDGVTNVVSDKASWSVAVTDDADIIAFFDRIPYVRGLAHLADRGKVTGSGYCPAGKKVTLRATANRGYVFEGWYGAKDGNAGEIDLSGQPVAKTPALIVDRTARPAKSDARQTVITEVDGSVTYFAKFITNQEDIEAVSLDLDGVPLSAEDAFATNLICGVAVDWPVVSGGLSATTVKASGLPAGLKLVQDRATRAYSVVGVPTTASKVDKSGNVKPSVAKFTVTTAGRNARTFVVEIAVSPLPTWAVGSFDGAVQMGDIVGAASMTVAANGRVSGKYGLCGTNWTFSASGYTEFIDDDIETNRLFALDVMAKSGRMLRALRIEVTPGWMADIVAYRFPDAWIMEEDARAYAESLGMSWPYDPPLECVTQEVSRINCSQANGADVADAALMLHRGIWKDRSAKSREPMVDGLFDWWPVLEPWRNWVFDAENFPDVKMSVTTSGRVSFAGKLPDGVRASSSTTAYLVPESGHPRALFIVPTTKNAAGLLDEVVCPHDDL